MYFNALDVNLWIAIVTFYDLKRPGKIVTAYSTRKFYHYQKKIEESRRRRILRKKKKAIYIT